MPGRSCPPPAAARPEFALLLVFALLAAGIIAVGYLFYHRYETNLRAQVETQLAAVADLKIGELQHFRAERFADANLLSGNRYFSGSSGGSSGGRGRGRAGSHLGVGRKVPVARFLRPGHLMDARGVPRLSIRKARPRSPHPPAGAADLSGRASRRSWISTGTARRQGVPRAADPLLRGRPRGKAPLGAIALRIDPENPPLPLHHALAPPAARRRTLLARRYGDDVLFLNRLKYRADPPLSVRIPLDAKAMIPAVQAVLGREGIMEGTDYRGVPVLAHVRAVPGSPWHLVARMDLSEVGAPVRERLRLTVFLVVALLLAAATGVALLWRRQRARFYREQYEAEKEKSWLQGVISRSLNEIYVFDLETLRFQYANEGALRNLGYGMEELSRMPPADIKPPFTEEMFRDMIRPLVAGEKDLLVFETAHRRKDGSDYPVEVHLQLVPSGDRAVFLAFINDITDRKAVGERVRAASLLETALHRIDTQILEGANLRDVLGTVCEAIVESGYRLCWVGQPDPEGRVRQIACAGPAAGYTEGIDVRWDKTPGGSGPTGVAVRTGKPFLVRDTFGDPFFARWRDRAVRYGLRSMASFPLTSGEGKNIAVMHVYSDRRDAFGPEEVARLETFARQCSIALLNALRIERLRDAHQRLTFHIERMPLAYIVWDMGFRVREWNPAAERIFGWKAEEALGMSALAIVPPEARPQVDAVWAALVGKGSPAFPERQRPKDGKVISCEWFNTALHDSAGTSPAFSPWRTTSRRRPSWSGASRRRSAWRRWGRSREGSPTTSTTR